MKTNKLFYWSCLLLLSACRKDLPVAPVSTATPVFYFNGTIQGQHQSIQAGINNYYMFSSFVLDSPSVTSYTGYLKNRSCSIGNCPGSIRITIRNAVQRNFAIADTALYNGYYPYAAGGNGGAVANNVQFSDTIVNGVALNYHWSFGDGGTSTLHNPNHTFAQPGIYPVTLNITDTTGSVCTITNNWPIGPCGNAFVARFRAVTTGDTCVITDMSQGVHPINYLWNYGDGTTSAGPPTGHSYPTNGVYKITATETDATGYSAIFNYNVACAPTRHSAINYTISSSPVANMNNLGTIIVEWTDANGIDYSTSNITQPSGSSFQILSVDNYQFNENGQATQKIHAKISCLLSSGSSNVTITDGDVVFAIAHP